MTTVSLSFRRSVSSFFVALIIICLFLNLSYRDSGPKAPTRLRNLPYGPQLPWHQAPSTADRVPCYGPRGKILDENSEDQVHALSLDIPFPEPVGGSYETLDLPKTWHTPRTRYGPYGYGELGDNYNRTMVDWQHLNWAALQNECLQQNRYRFRTPTTISKAMRFHLRDDNWVGTEPLKRRPFSKGRTAIVLRAWDTYSYSTIDMYHIRSLIVEAGLSSGGKYVVFLLVDVKDEQRRIFEDPQCYQKALEDLVPEELRSVAVLFNTDLLRSWYPDLDEHSVFYQVYQPMQLFAQAFSDFDHYWQLEMDSKILGHSGDFLDALSNFARNEPRKQSVERSSYFYMPKVHGPYSEFRAAINKSVEGGGIWGPIGIPDVPDPIGLPPPAPAPEDDDFVWGVGEDADLILTNPIADITAARFWPFKDWIKGFRKGVETRRFYSPVAMTRCSWNLLNAMHYAQMNDGLQLPSESTPASFALYHGLKVIFPPQPWFHHPQRDVDISLEDLEQLFNGGTPEENALSNHGLSFGSALYNPEGNYELFNGGTWWWVPGYPGRVMRSWMQQEKQENQELPSMLRLHNGEIYAPLIALHPVKSGDIVE